MKITDRFEQAIPVFELEKNPNEEINSLLLQDKIKEFCEKIGLEEEFINYIKIGYRDNLGYYAYTETDQGLISMVKGFPSLEFIDSFCIIIRELLMIKALSEHLSLITKSDSEEYYNHFVMIKLNDFYNGNIPDDIVNIISVQQEQMKRVK